MVSVHVNSKHLSFFEHSLIQFIDFDFIVRTRAVLSIKLKRCKLC